MADIKTLVEDIYSLFDPDKPHEVNEKNLYNFTFGLGNIVRQRLAQRETKDFALRFSGLGKPDRQIWYEAHGYKKEDLLPKTYLKFLFGDMIEALLLFLAKEAGHEVTDEQKEVEALGVLGHIDARIDGRVVDVKSASPFGFKKFEDGSLLQNDPFGYIQQLSGYNNVLTPGEPSYFLAMDKVSADITLMELPVSVSEEFPPAERIEHLKEVISSDQIPPRCYEPVPDGKSGNMKLGTECSYCGFKDACFPEARLFLYSTGPRWLTTVAREPDVFEVK